MAIQVNGTPVITNALALNGITSIDATTAAAIGAGGVGGGGEIELTTAEAVTIGDLLGVNSVGKVKSIGPLTGFSQDDQDNALKFTNPSRYSGDQMECRTSPDGSKMAMIYYVYGGNTLNDYYCVIGTFNSDYTTITWGTPVTFAGYGGGEFDMDWVSNSTIVMAYHAYVSSLNRMYVRSISVSGTTPTIGSGTQLNSTSGNQFTQRRHQLKCWKDGYFIVGYADYSGGWRSWYKVGSASGTSISLGTGYQVSTSSNPPNFDINPNNNKVAVCIPNSSGYSNFRIGTRSGTALSYTSSSPNVGNSISGVMWLSDTHIGWGSGVSHAGEVNSSNQLINVASTTSGLGPDAPLCGRDPVTNTIYHTGYDNTATTTNQYLNVRKFVFNTSTWLFDEIGSATNVSKTWNTISTSHHKGDTRWDATNGYVYTWAAGNDTSSAVGHAGAGSYGRVVSIQVADYVNNSFVGVAKQSVSTNQTVKIGVAGGTVTGLSGYQAGKPYTVDNITGDLIEASSIAEAAVIGLSTSSIFIK